MYTTAQDSLQAIEQLGLPASVIDILNNKGPFRFRQQYRPPIRYFNIAESILKKNPESENYIPIFEMNREVVYAFDTKIKKFVEYYYSDESAAVIGDNYQQFIGSIFVDLIYADLYPIATEVAEFLEFKHMNKLREFSERDDESSAADAKKKFVMSLEE